MCCCQCWKNHCCCCVEGGDCLENEDDNMRKCHLWWMIPCFPCLAVAVCIYLCMTRSDQDANDNNNTENNPSSAPVAISPPQSSFSAILQPSALGQLRRNRKSNGILDTFGYGQTSLPILVAVWEWQDDDNSWKPYHRSVVQHLDNQKKKGYHTVDLSKQSKNLPYVIDLDKMTQTRKNTGKVRAIRERFTDQNTVWEWCSDQSKWEQYDPKANEELEKAHKQGKTKVDLSCLHYSLPYIIDLKANIQTNKNTGKKRQVRRQFLGQGRTLGRSMTLPRTWLSQDNTDEYELCAVSPGSVECNEVKAMFETTMQNQAIKIFRIQNPTLWHFYTLRRNKMLEALGEDQVNEKRLFHGTSRGAVDGICRTNFDFRVSGSATGTLFGHGVYFAEKASYSNRFTGKTVKTRYMFVARVLCGKFTKGGPDVRRPPPIDTTKPTGPAYNSCVDDLNNPTMFVIFDYSQCYPEYLLEYSAS